MKFRIKINVGQVDIDETLSAGTPDEVVKLFRKQVESKVSFAIKLAMKALDDQSFFKRVVEMHNKKFGASENAPSTAEQFLAFGERAGYVTRLDS